MIYAILWYSDLFHPRILHPMFPQDALIWGPWKLLTEAQRPSFWQGPSFPNGSSHASESTWAACADGCLFDVERDPTEQRNLYRETWEEHLRNLEKKKQSWPSSIGPSNPGFFKEGKHLEQHDMKGWPARVLMVFRGGWEQFRCHHLGKRFFGHPDSTSRVFK